MKSWQRKTSSRKQNKINPCGRALIVLPVAMLLLTPPSIALCQSKPLPTPESTINIEELTTDASATQYFGKATGYIHPFIAIEGRYSDNIYNTKENEKDDFLTTISPGIWVTTPRSREIVLNLNPSNTAPGGLAYELQRGEMSRKFQAYALYEADILSYSSESQNDVTDHTAEGLVSYAFSGGLTLELIDKYIRGHDDFRSDGSRDGVVQKYDSNVLNFSADYAFSPKFRIEGVYTNFYLDYDREDRAYRDRTDNVGALYLYYTYSPKTSLFLNGEYIKSDFDTASENDADQYNLYAGMQWSPTRKTNLRTRLGYVNRSLDEGLVDDASEFAGDLRIRYNVTEKTRLTLLAASNIEVPDNSDYSFLRRNFLRLGYRQDITPKIEADINAHLENSDYSGGIRDDRSDDFFRITPSIRYTFREWMMATLSYIYENRDSNFDVNDYSTNTVFLKLTFSL